MSKPKHYHKSELTVGYCPCCEQNVDDLVISKKICTGCLEVTTPDEAVLNEDEDEDNDW